MDEVTEALAAALIALIDARLTELGLVEAEAEETPPPAKDKGKGKGAAKGKGKAADADEITIESLTEKFTDLINKAGKDVARGLLTKMKVKKLSELDESKYAAADKVISTELAKHEASGEDENEEDLFG